MPDFSFIKPKTETIKENAKPKPRVFAEFSKNIRGKGIQGSLVKKKLSGEELAKIKLKIREKIAKSNHNRLLVQLFIVVLLLIPLFFIGQRFFGSIAKGNQDQLENAYLKRREYVAKGYKELESKDFRHAKWFFEKAAAIDSDDYLLQFGLATTYVKLCRYYDLDCAKAARKVQFLKGEYGELPEIKELAKEFAEM